MRKMGMAVLASVLAGLLLLAALPASASAELAGFQYQREIAIHENSGETLRDYQVLVALAGSDFPEEAQPEQTVDTSGSKENGSSTPGFAAVVAIIGLLAAYLRRRI